MELNCFPCFLEAESNQNVDGTQIKWLFRLERQKQQKVTSAAAV